MVEVGAGQGELTQQMANGKWLMTDGSQLIAVEKDRELAKNLSLKFKSMPRSELALLRGLKFKVINDDILKILPQITRNLTPDAWKLIGNIPYYLTGFLFRVISELERKPSLIVFTIQKEVAERICAQPPKMNLLAASIQVWASPEIIGVIPPSDFEPPPKVTSAIIKLRVINCGTSQDQWSCDVQKLNNYYKIIKVIFKQPRKTLLNNLADGLNLPKKEVVEKLTQLNLTGRERGQDLSIGQLVQLTKVLINLISN